jgi:hypothetical protein
MPSPTLRSSSPVSRPTGPPTGSGRPAAPSRSTWHERHPDLLVADRARARELAWRGRVDQRVIELERPGWLRELGEPPATVKGQRAWRQTVSRVEQYRERYGIIDPDRALGPEPRHVDLEQRRTTAPPTR